MNSRINGYVPRNETIKKILTFTNPQNNKCSVQTPADPQSIEYLQNIFNSEILRTIQKIDEAED